jgi:hypothetical protein
VGKAEGFHQRAIAGQPFDVSVFSKFSIFVICTDVCRFLLVTKTEGVIKFQRAVAGQPFGITMFSMFSMFIICTDECRLFPEQIKTKGLKKSQIVLPGQPFGIDTFLKF